MTVQDAVLIVIALVAVVLAYHLVQTLSQLRKTLQRLDETLGDTQRVLDHADRVLSQIDRTTENLSAQLSGIAQGARSVGVVTSLLGGRWTRALAIAGGVLAGVGAVLKKGNPPHGEPEGGPPASGGDPQHEVREVQNEG